LIQKTRRLFWFPRFGRAERPDRMHVLRALRNGLERMLVAERFAQRGPFEGRRAHERSLRLLVACLTPEQRVEFARSNAFKVRGESGQCYRITYDKSMNIEVLAPSGMVLRRLCAGPVDIPTPAVMLAQKLMLEAQEAEFLRIARTIPDPDVVPLVGQVDRSARASRGTPC
jgi:hypothetical protein